MKAVHVVDAVRTPTGRCNGALSSVRPDDLAAHVLRELLARTPDPDPERIEDGCFGIANGAGEENPRPPRLRHPRGHPLHRRGPGPRPRPRSPRKRQVSR
ncbi:hypothetical protein H4K36_31315 [Streptomyces sp. DHE7-1]|nr:hypothetical protein [Streptomyces sp. DHE7-1]